MDEAAKERLLASFTQYLERLDEEDAPDSGDQEEAAPDLFSLLAELAALKSEVKLESRQVKTALDEFRALFDALRESNSRLEDEQTRRRESERSADRHSQKDLLLELLELRDRLAAGREQAQRFHPGWPGRRAAREFVHSMAEGMSMNLRRLDETLARRGVRAITVLNRPFDPHTMHASELMHDPDQPAGWVLKELRKGFMLDDQLLRSAEVAVNRPRAGRHEGSPDPRPKPAGGHKTRLNH